MIENKKIFYENSIVVGAVINNSSAIIVNEFLDELCFLTETAGGKVLRRFIQKLEKPNPKTFIGSGKIQEIQFFIKKRRYEFLSLAGQNIASDRTVGPSRICTIAI